MSNPAKQRFFRLLDLLRAGDIDAASRAISQALQVTPKDPNLLQLGAQAAEMRGEPERATTLLRKAVNLYPQSFEMTMNLSRLYVMQKRYHDAVKTLKHYTDYDPDRIEVWETMARAAQWGNLLPDAVSYWKKTIELAPQHHEARGQLAFCQSQICDWSNLRYTPTPETPPNLTAILSDDPDLQKQSAEAYCLKRFGTIRPLPPTTARTHEKLRIGYLSSDFHAHATSWLIAELFELHNKDKFEIYAYSYGIEDHSPIRERLRKGADHFVELNALTPEGCAKRIRQDEIDILIDLKGHTTGARLDILAYHPSPKQLHWLGFPATTGASFIDGFIADPITVPNGQEQFFTEKVLRLPTCYQINDQQKQVAKPNDRAAYGLPEGSLVFASFNQTYKITPGLFNIWCALLHEVPGSVLWLYRSNAFAPDNLRKEAELRGIDPERLVFAEPLTLPEHLARYHHVDIALDTFPVGGHTTTSDALWVGAPVITLQGNSFVSRVASSLLCAAELPELVTETLDAYKAKALELARNETLRKTIHAHLQNKRLKLPLFNTPRFVKEFEALLAKEL